LGKKKQKLEQKKQNEQKTKNAHLQKEKKEEEDKKVERKVLKKMSTKNPFGKKNLFDENKSIPNWENRKTKKFSGYLEYKFW